MNRLYAILITFVATAMCVAQSSLTKQINQLKRSGMHFYAESTMNTEAEARENASLMLANFINDYINENDLPREYRVSEATLQAEYIVGKRGDMHRVFAYIEKSKCIPVAEQETVGQSLVAQKESHETKPADDKVAEVGGQSESHVENEPAQSSEFAFDQEWKQEAINSLVEKGTLDEVIVQLNRLKMEYRVTRFGTNKDCRNPATSFWLIFANDGERRLIALLGEGTDQRPNYMSRQYDKLSNYSGNGAIWFNLSR